jgi:hypothetical protein
VQQGCQLRCRVLLHRGEGMGVDIEGDLDPLVAEPLLYNLDRDTGLQQQRGARMPQPMKLDGAQPSHLNETTVFVLPQIIHLQRMA